MGDIERRDDKAAPHNTGCVTCKNVRKSSSFGGVIIQEKIQERVREKTKYFPKAT